MIASVDEYLESQVLTATPYQLHLLVVDGAIRYAVQGEQAIVAGDIEGAHFALNEARRFVGELIAGLDPTRLPEVVEKVRSVFLFVYRNLIQADVERDVKRVVDSLKILRMHRETWLALGERLKTETAPIESAQRSGRSWDS